MLCRHRMPIRFTLILFAGLLLCRESPAAEPSLDIRDFYFPTTARLDYEESLCMISAELPVHGIDDCLDFYSNMSAFVEGQVDQVDVLSMLQHSLSLDDATSVQEWTRRTLVIDGQKQKSFKYLGEEPLLIIRTPEGDIMRRGGGKTQVQITRYAPGALTVYKATLYELLSREEGFFTFGEWIESGHGDHRVFKRQVAQSWAQLVVDKHNNFVCLHPVFKGQGQECLGLAMHFAPRVYNSSVGPVSLPTLTIAFRRKSSSSDAPGWSVRGYRFTSIELDQPIDAAEFELSARKDDIVVIESDDGESGEAHWARQPVAAVVSTPKEELRRALDPRLTCSADPGWSLGRLAVVGVVGCLVLIIAGVLLRKRQQRLL